MFTVMSLTAGETYQSRKQYTSLNKAVVSANRIFDTESTVKVLVLDENDSVRYIVNEQYSRLVC